MSATVSTGLFKSDVLVGRRISFTTIANLEEVFFRFKEEHEKNNCPFYSRNKIKKGERIQGKTAKQWATLLNIEIRYERITTEEERNFHIDCGGGALTYNKFFGHTCECGARVPNNSLEQLYITCPPSQRAERMMQLWTCLQCSNLKVHHEDIICDECAQVEHSITLEKERKIELRKTHKNLFSQVLEIVPKREPDSTWLETKHENAMFDIILALAKMATKPPDYTNYNNITITTTTTKQGDEEMIDGGERVEEGDEKDDGVNQKRVKEVDYPNISREGFEEKFRAIEWRKTRQRGRRRLRSTERRIKHAIQDYQESTRGPAIEAAMLENESLLTARDLLQRFDDMPPNETYVGGAGDCWIQLKPFLGNTLGGIHVTAKDIVEAFKAELYAQDEEDLDDFYDELEAWEVIFGVMPDGDYHIYACYPEEVKRFHKRPSGARRVILGSFFPWLEKHSHKSNGVERYVGAVGEILESAKVIYGPEMLKGEAMKELSQELTARPRTKYYLNAKQKLEVEKYLNSPVACDSVKPQSSDHAALVVSRDLMRQELLRLEHPDNDVIDTLHIGATAEDFRRYQSRPNHSFYFHEGEAKDSMRSNRVLAEWLAAEIKKSKLPALRSKFGEKSKIVRMSAEQVRMGINNAILRRQAIVRKPKKAGCLYFSDSLYGVTEKELVDYFRQTGASHGFATLFIPTYLYGNEPLDASQVYNLEHDYSWPSMEEILSVIWPELVAGIVVMDQLPGSKQGWEERGEKTLFDNVMNWVHEIIKSHMTSSFDWFKNWLDGLVHSPVPIESLFGVELSFLKYQALAIKWIERLRQAFIKQFRHLCVTWKDGYQNGYRHKEHEWKKWIQQRVYKDGDMTIASEVTSRIGEMVLIKFWVNEASDVIIHNPTPPKHLQAMRIWDWNKTIKNNPTWLEESVNPVWTSCMVSDFYEVYSWAIAEPAKSIDFSVVATACNRVRRGLSLVSNVSHEGLSVMDEDLVNFALNVYLAVQRDLRNIEDIETEKSKITGFITNLKDCLKKFVSAVLILSTVGLVIPAAMLARWLLQRTDSFDFVEMPKERPRIKEHAKKTIELPETRTYPITLPAVGAAEVNRCLICNLVTSGEITGQTFAVDRCTHDSKPVDMGMTRDEATAARLGMETAIEFHRGTVSPKVLDAARLHENFLSVLQLEGSNFSTMFHYVLGGPGTGKSYIARSLMRVLERQGYSTAMYLPLAALKSDYDKVTMPDGENYKFQAETWFKMSAFKSVDILFVDEFTLVDSNHFKGYVNYVMPKHIFLIGDAKQQHKTPDISIHPGVAESRYWPEIEANCSKHELQRNFRFQGKGAAWRVKWLNRRYGYRMYTTETDASTPDFMTVDDYHRLDKKPEGNYVFTHASAQPAFGMNSGPGLTEENHSVYSAQGQTVETSAVAILDGDRNAFRRPGAIIVALTRSRQNPLLVIYDDLAEVVDAFMVECGANTADDLEAIVQSEWPKPTVTGSPIQALSPAEESLNKFIKIGKIEDVDPTTKPKEVKETIVFQSSQTEKDMMDLNVLEWVLEVFETCTYDVLPFELRREYLREVFWPIAGASSIVQRKSDGGWEFKPGVSAKGKLMVSRNMFENWLKSKTSYCVYNGDDKKPEFTVVGGQENPEDLILLFKKGHVKKLDKKSFLRRVVFEERTGGVNRIGFSQEFCNPWYITPTGLHACTYMKGSWKVDAKELDVLGNDTGHISSFSRKNNPDVPSEFQTFSACPSSQYVSNSKQRSKRFESKPRHKGKLRMGVDGYKFAHLIDGSEALKVATGIEYPGAFGAALQPPKDFRSGFSYNFQSTFFRRTKGGRVSRREKPLTRSLLPGAGNLFTGDVNETMRALQRVCGRRPTKGLSKEGYDFFRDAMTESYHACHNQKRLDKLEMESVTHHFWTAANERNYVHRTMTERAKHQNVLTKRVTNKAQYKPHKDGRIDNAKTGQTITSTSPYWNIVHGAAMRVVNYIFKQTLKEDVFYDSHETSSQFRVRMSRAIKQLPKGVMYGIVDGEEFDAGQTHGTLVAEMIHRQLMGVGSRFIDSYYRIRKPGRFVYYGHAAGKTEYEKGSGFSDTLLGNTTLEQMVGYHAIKGDGPKVIGIKGDDFLKVQFNLSPNYEFIRKLELYTNLKLKVEISRKGGEFIGCTVNDRGMFLGIPRMALKAVANRFRDIKHFREYQQSLRDKIEEIRDDGVDETISANSEAMNINRNTVEVCLAIVDSISHLNEEQFLQMKTRRTHNPPPPNRRKTFDVHTFNAF